MHSKTSRQVPLKAPFFQCNLWATLWATLWAISHLWAILWATLWAISHLWATLWATPARFATVSDSTTV